MTQICKQPYETSPHAGLQIHTYIDYHNPCACAPRVNEGHRRLLCTHEVIPMEHDIQTKYHIARNNGGH